MSVDLDRLIGTAVSMRELDRVLGRVRTVQIAAMASEGGESCAAAMAEAASHLEVLLEEMSRHPAMCPHGCGHWTNPDAEPCCPREAAARSCPHSDPGHAQHTGCPSCGK